MVVKWDTISKNDLKDFKNYSKSINTNEYIIELVKYVNNLAEQPHMGKIYAYTKGYIIRQLIYEKHRILYYIEDVVVHIIAVIHHKQSIQRKIEYIKRNYNIKD